MPEMDGIALCQEIRRRTGTYHIYLILLTAREDRESQLEGFRAGIDEFIRKPYDIDELDAHIKVGLRMVALELGLVAEREKVRQYAREMETLAAERAKQLVHAEKMVTLGTLAAGVAHEINNPATFIAGNTLILNDFLPFIEKQLQESLSKNGDQEQIRYILDELPGVITGIRNGTERIARIVNGLKTFSRQKPPSRVPFDVHAKIDDALLLCANAFKHGVILEKNLAAEVYAVSGDPFGFEQVIINLVTNAVDAMELQAERFLKIETANLGVRLLVRVSDSGPGVPAEIRTQIWNPFFTTKPVGKGTGLGLSISQGIIEEMGGEISLHELHPHGTAFQISLRLLPVADCFPAGASPLH